MNYEDFVTGYALGYNNGKSSSGGSSGQFDWIPIYKKYHLIGTNCYIGIADANSDILDRPYQWGAYSDGDNTEHMDRMKWYPLPYYSERNLYIVWFIDNAAVGITNSAGSLNTIRSYTNTVNEPPYEEFILESISKTLFDNAEITIVETTKEYNNRTTTTFKLVLNYNLYTETVTASGDVIKEFVRNYSVNLLEKTLDIYTDGRIQKFGSTSHHQREVFAGISMDFEPYDAYRDTLQAWFDCTGIEEVAK